MEPRGNSKSPLESFPFFAKYGHYILATVILATIVNLLLRSWRKGEQLGLQPDKQLAGSTKELSPDEGKFKYTQLHATYLIKLQFIHAEK